jgi:hypothetical protein
MTWPKYVLLALYGLSVLYTIGSIGKPRQPTTPESAVAALIFTGLLVVLVVLA